jgi:hypothetical protein
MAAAGTAAAKLLQVTCFRIAGLPAAAAAKLQGTCCSFAEGSLPLLQVYLLP